MLDTPSRQTPLHLAAASVALRPATKDDADHLAQLVNYAGEGLPHFFWSRTANAPDAAERDPWEIGRQRAMRESGAFSYRNATMAVVDGAVAGCLIAYPIAETAEPIDPTTMPPMFVPIQELENLAPGTQYVGVLAVHPELRGHGVGTRLLAEAERVSEGRTMSIIVSDGNPEAWRLYQRLGYRQVASRPMVKEDWVNEGETWILLLKPPAERDLS